MRSLLKLTPEIILLIYVIAFVAFKSPEQAWDRVINSDGKGYYAYLPAIFIYKDLRFGFVEKYEADYYPGNRSVFKEFRNSADGRTVNKYFPGLAIVWLPFFLSAHLATLVAGLPADGYSIIYQYAIAISALLFLYLGIRWTMTLLNTFGAGRKAAALIAMAIGLGTNLLFFTIVEASMTHVYSFALIAGFMLTCHRLFHDRQKVWVIIAPALFVLIVMIRPTNALILLLVPFLAGSTNKLKESFKLAWSRKGRLAEGMIPAVILAAIPPVLWYLQTRCWLPYTYGEERLDFLHPHMLNILFSYNRGWFVYTPLAFLSLAGLPVLFRENRYRFGWMLAFLLLYIYVASCWWVWYYASKCGQRVFIDIFPVVALLLFHALKLFNSQAWRKIMACVILFLVLLNLLQFYQHARWIFPPYDITRQIYRESFFSLTRKAKVFLPEEGIVAGRSYRNDMEKEMGWMNPATRTGSEHHLGQWSSAITHEMPYSAGLEAGIDSLFLTANRLIRVESEVLTHDEKTGGTLVVDYQLDGKSLSYNVLDLNNYVRRGRWTRIQAGFYVPADMPPGGTVKIYFFIPSEDKTIWIDDLAIDFLSLKDEPDYRKIEGIILPEKIH